MSLLLLPYPSLILDKEPIYSGLTEIVFKSLDGEARFRSYDFLVTLCLITERL